MHSSLPNRLLRTESLHPPPLLINIHTGIVLPMAGATATLVVVVLALTGAVARTEFEEDIYIHSDTLGDYLHPRQPQFSTFKR
jgi:hypothetical protein